jgi:hypothetical protein
MTNSSTIRQLQIRPIECDHLKLDSWKIWKTENLEMGKSTLHDRTSWIELSSITFCSSSFIVFYMCMFVCTCLTSARFCAPVYWPSMSSFFFIPRNSWKFAEKYSDYSCIFLKMFREKSSGKKNFQTGLDAQQSFGRNDLSISTARESMKNSLKRHQKNRKRIQTKRITYVHSRRLASCLPPPYRLNWFFLAERKRGHRSSQFSALLIWIMKFGWNASP